MTTDALKKVLGEASLSDGAKAAIVEAWETDQRPIS